MNIQIFGTKKSFDTKKAQRYFKERRIKVQFIDLREKEMSKGELQSVMRAVGGIDALLDPKAKDQDALALVQHLAESQRFDKLLENQQVLAEPIVRNGRAATVGYAPDVWKTWEQTHRPRANARYRSRRQAQPTGSPRLFFRHAQTLSVIFIPRAGT